MMGGTPKKVGSGVIQATHKTRVLTIPSHDPERALREQLHIEIENRTKACANKSYECSQTRVDGFEFCFKHILQNPRSPFKQCSYLYPNGRKCLEPAPKHSTKKDIGTSTYCFEHSRLAQLTKLRSTVGKCKPVVTSETILNDLSKYVKLDGYHGESSCTPAIDPVLDHDVLVAPRRNILDFASDSESDSEVPTLSTSTRNYELDDSDNESVDSQSDDLLKHAGIYSTEEAAAITKDKLKKLQGLYVEQFQRLQHVLKERRRVYLHALKREKETLSSIYNQPLDTPEERVMYAKLKALNHYHRKFGMHAVLHKKLQEKRRKITEGAEKKLPYHNKCLFTEGGVKCGERSVPATKYCKKHILEDKRQVLFRACGIEKADILCQEPVPNVFQNATCILHMSCPEPRQYIHKKYESDTEDEDEPKLKKPKQEEEETEEMEVKEEEVEVEVKEEEQDIKEEVFQISEIGDLKLEGISEGNDDIILDDPTQNYTEPNFTEAPDEMQEISLKVE